jgi:hypothetical protein
MPSIVDQMTSAMVSHRVRNADINQIDAELNNSLTGSRSCLKMGYRYTISKILVFRTNT